MAAASFEGSVLDSKWIIGRVLGSGACSQVYEAKRISGNDLSFVVKLNQLPASSSKRKKNKHDTAMARFADLLYFEHVIYSTILNQHPRYFAKSEGYGESDGVRYLVLQRLGVPLSYGLCPQRLANVGRDVLGALRLVHSAGYVYGDIKPENIMLGVWEDGELRRVESEARLVDFGVATRYRSALTGSHRVGRNGTQAAGTARFASIAAIRDESPPSRRDDCEALGHVLLWCACDGVLPWDSVKSDAELEAAKLDVIDPDATVGACKLAFSEPYRTFLQICRDTPFADQPDYAALFACLDRLAVGKHKSGSRKKTTEEPPTKRRAPKSAALPENQKRRTSPRKASERTRRAAKRETIKYNLATSYEACLAKARQCKARK